VPSEARKRGSGGGSPRRYDDLLSRSFGLGCSVKAVLELRHTVWRNVPRQYVDGHGGISKYERSESGVALGGEGGGPRQERSIYSLSWLGELLRVMHTKARAERQGEEDFEQYEEWGNLGDPPS
jgi:hypothetical protein